MMESEELVYVDLNKPQESAFVGSLVASGWYETRSPEQIQIDDLKRRISALEIPLHIRLFNNLKRVLTPKHKHCGCVEDYD